MKNNHYSMILAIMFVFCLLAFGCDNSLSNNGNNNNQGNENNNEQGNGNSGNQGGENTGNEYREPLKTLIYLNGFIFNQH